MTIEEIRYFQMSLRDNAERDKAHAIELQAHAAALEHSALVIEQLLGQNAKLEAENKRLQAKVEEEQRRNTIQISHLEGNVIENVDTMIASCGSAGEHRSAQNILDYGSIDTTDDGQCDRKGGYVRSTSNELLRQREPKRLFACGE